mgnify:CR=1 FL=1
MTLEKGTDAQLTATVEPADADNKAVTWTPLTEENADDTVIAFAQRLDAAKVAVQDGQIRPQPGDVARRKGFQVAGFAQRGLPDDPVGVEPGVEFNAVPVTHADHPGQRVEFAESLPRFAAYPGAEGVVL